MPFMANKIAGAKSKDFMLLVLAVMAMLLMIHEEGLLHNRSNSPVVVQITSDRQIKRIKRVVSSRPGVINLLVQIAATVSFSRYVFTDTFGAF
jgi:hypothetical protein